MSTLDDLLSQDPARIWAGAGVVRTLRDPDELATLAAHTAEIRASTRGIDLGGMVRSNATHLAFALRKLDFVRRGTGCLCELYPQDDLYNPTREQEAGNVDVLETVLADGGWPDHYVCRCAVCGRTYRVEEREYHYTWWAWTLVSP